MLPPPIFYNLNKIVLESPNSCISEFPICNLSILSLNIARLGASENLASTMIPPLKSIPRFKFLVRNRKADKPIKDADNIKAKNLYLKKLILNFMVFKYTIFSVLA